MSENEQEKAPSVMDEVFPNADRMLRSFVAAIHEPCRRREEELITTIGRLEEELAAAQEVPNDLGELLREEKQQAFNLKDTLHNQRKRIKELAGELADVKFDNRTLQTRFDNAEALLEQEKTVSLSRLQDLLKAEGRIEELEKDIKLSSVSEERQQRLEGIVRDQKKRIETLEKQLHESLEELSGPPSEESDAAFILRLSRRPLWKKDRGRLERIMEKIRKAERAEAHVAGHIEELEERLLTKSTLLKEAKEQLRAQTRRAAEADSAAWDWESAAVRARNSLTTKGHDLKKALAQVVELGHQLEQSNADLEKARDRLHRASKKAVQREAKLIADFSRLAEACKTRGVHESWPALEGLIGRGIALGEDYGEVRKEEGVEEGKLGPPPCKERDAKGQRCFYLEGHGGGCDGGKPTNPCHPNYGVQWRQGKGGGWWVCVRCDKVIEKAEEK